MAWAAVTPYQVHAKLNAQANTAAVPQCWEVRCVPARPKSMRVHQPAKNSQKRKSPCSTSTQRQRGDSGPPAKGGTRVQIAKE